MSVIGTRKHSGTCSCMDLLTGFRRRFFKVELPTDLDGLIELALRVDARLQQRDQQGHCSFHLVSEFPR